MDSNSLVMISSKDQGKTLESPAFVELPGQKVQGKFPRYVAATNELFFSGEINAAGEAVNCAPGAGPVTCTLLGQTRSRYHAACPSILSG